METRRGFLATLLGLLPVPFLAKKVDWIAKHTQSVNGKIGPRDEEAEAFLKYWNDTQWGPRVEEHYLGKRDYFFLRHQIGDFQSTFYGPHPCQRCGVTIVKQAMEEGDGEYELKGEQGSLEMYKPHLCSKANTYRFVQMNDKHYDLFVDNKTGELLDGKNIYPFLDWTPEMPHAARWARFHYEALPKTSNQMPRGFHSYITTYLDSEISPVIDPTDWSLQQTRILDCTRKAPHVCRVNGPCNGLPRA